MPVQQLNYFSKRDKILHDLPPILAELVEQALFAGTGSTVDDKHPLDAHRIEVRYLLKHPEQQLPALKAWATKTGKYRTHTVYIDTKTGTWSKGKSQVKFRLRHYNDEPTWWIELKTNLSGVVDKTRRLITLEEMDKLGLYPVAAVTYNRQEFEAPGTSSFRVTLDDSLLCWFLPFNLLLSSVATTKGQPIAKLQRYVLELKDHATQPQWLNLPERWTGSKSRWSLAALAGRPDTIAPSITNEQIGKLKSAIDEMHEYNPYATPWISSVSDW